MSLILFFNSGIIQQYLLITSGFNMCLAFSTSAQCSNNLFARVWRRIASTPLRLFSFGVIIHLLIGSAILVYADASGVPINTNILMSGFVYGVLALPVLGFLMTWLPKKYALSPVHYGRYNSVYLIFMIALIMIEYGSLFSQSWAEVGVWLLLPGWLIALQGLRHLHLWISASVEIFSGTLLILLFLNAALLVFNAFGHSVDLSMLTIMPLLSMLLFWPMIWVVTVLFVIKTAYSNRVISI